MSPNYYAVIPAFVRYADIPPNAKLLYGEITALASKEGYCWATNRHFAELYGVSPATVSEWVAALRSLGAITYEIEDNTRRKIYLSEKAEGGIGISRRGVSEKAEHSIKDSITTNTSAYAREKEEEKPERKKADTSYLQVFTLFPKPDPSWRRNRTQIEAARALLKERGLEAVKDAIEWYQQNKHLDFIPSMTSPYDLDTKWAKLEAFSEKI